MSTLSDPATWLDQYGDILYRHALFRLNDPMAAEEMVQETLLAAWQGRARFSGKSSEKTWLVGILKHKVIDHLRKTIREQPHVDEQALDELIDASFDQRGHWQIDIEQWSQPDASLAQQQFWETLQDCVDQLPRRIAALFILREIDGLDSGEICKELEISTTNNLWVMLSRMRMRLRQCLDQRWFDHRIY